MEFLWEDLVIAMPLTFLMGATPPADILTRHMPEETLIGIPTIMSVMGAVVIHLVIQIGVFIGTYNDPFNVRPTVDPDI